LLNRFKKKRENGQTDLKIDKGTFEIHVSRYYSIIQWIADVVLGCFFVTGSILNLMGVNPLYPNIAWLIGSLAMTVRPIIRVIKHITIKSKINE
jgi:uncharacterized membrane protein